MTRKNGIVIQQYYFNGDMVQGSKIDISDSIVQRSNIHGAAIEPPPAPYEETEESVAASQHEDGGEQRAVQVTPEGNQPEAKHGGGTTPSLRSRRAVPNKPTPHPSHLRVKGIVKMLSAVLIISTVFLTPYLYDAINAAQFRAYKREVRSLPPTSQPTLELTLTLSDEDGGYTITWDTLDDTEHYLLQEDEDANFSSPTTVYFGSLNVVVIDGKDPGRYYYRLKATSYFGYSSWSLTRAVLVNGSIKVNGTAPYTGPTVLRPPVIAVNATDNDGTYEILWSGVENASSYLLQEDDNPFFSSPVVVYSGPSMRITITNKTDGTFCYRVRAVDAQRVSDWSQTKAVTVSIPPPPPVPELNITNYSVLGTYEVHWTGSDNACDYTLEEAMDGSFTTSRALHSGNETTFIVRDRDNGTYYYRVRARNEFGASPWSAVRAVVVRRLAVSDLNLTWAVIAPGAFLMGSTMLEEQQPIHEVTINYSFLMGKFEITQAQWAMVMGVNPSAFNTNGSNPVESVSWNDVQEFLRRLNALEPEHTYRLPTEAEWEYCCRANSTGKYSHGNSTEESQNYSWCRENAGNHTHPVGLTLPNGWGLYDMYGNVFEWCQDDWHGNFTGAPCDGAAWGNGSGANRVIRGGFWWTSASYCDSAVRYYAAPDQMSWGIGFRVVCEG